MAKIGHIRPKRATLEMGSALNRQRLRLYVTGNESVRLENDVRAIDGSLDLAVDNYPLSLNAPLMSALGDTVIDVQFRSPSI